MMKKREGNIMSELIGFVVMFGIVFVVMWNWKRKIDARERRIERQRALAEEKRMKAHQKKMDEEMKLYDDLDDEDEDEE